MEERYDLRPDEMPVIAPLDALSVDDLARILQTPKGSLIAQYRKLVRFHGAELLFTDAAIKEIARIALERGTGARGLRSVVKAVLEGFCSILSQASGTSSRTRRSGVGRR